MPWQYGQLPWQYRGQKITPCGGAANRRLNSPNYPPSMQPSPNPRRAPRPKSPTNVGSTSDTVAFQVISIYYSIRSMLLSPRIYELCSFSSSLRWPKKRSYFLRRLRNIIHVHRKLRTIFVSFEMRRKMSKDKDTIILICRRAQNYTTIK